MHLPVLIHKFENAFALSRTQRVPFECNCANVSVVVHPDKVFIAQIDPPQIDSNSYPTLPHADHNCTVLPHYKYKHEAKNQSKQHTFLQILPNIICDFSCSSSNNPDSCQKFQEFQQNVLQPNGDPTENRHSLIKSHTHTHTHVYTYTTRPKDILMYMCITKKFFPHHLCLLTKLLSLRPQMPKIALGQLKLCKTCSVLIDTI